MNIPMIEIVPLKRAVGVFNTGEASKRLLCGNLPVEIDQSEEERRGRIITEKSQDDR